MRITMPALRGLELVFERAGLRGHGRHRGNRVICQQRAAEIGMQHGAGEIKDIHQRAGLCGGERGAGLFEQQLRCVINGGGAG